MVVNYNFTNLNILVIVINKEINIMSFKNTCPVFNRAYTRTSNPTVFELLGNSFCK